MPLHSSPSWGFNVRRSAYYFLLLDHHAPEFRLWPTLVLIQWPRRTVFFVTQRPSSNSACHASSPALAAVIAATVLPYLLETALPASLHINCRTSFTWFTAVPTACWEVFCAWEQANTQDSQEDKRTADGLEQCPELNVWCRVGTASLLFYWFLKLAQS